MLADSTANPPLKVGIIVNDGDLPFLTFDLLERSLQQSDYQIHALIVQKISDESTGKSSVVNKIKTFKQQWGWKRLFEKLTFSVMGKIERQLVKRHKVYAQTLQRKSADTYDVERISVTPIFSKSGLFCRYTDDDIQAIRDLNIDVLVRGGSGILQGDILTVCRFGVLSFHHANNDVNRGGPPGFWEVLLRQPSTGFIIQRLKPELDGGDVLFKGQIATSAMYSLNCARIYIKSSGFFHQLLQRIARDNALPSPLSKQPYANPLYKAPTLMPMLRYAYQTAQEVSLKVLRKLLKRDYRWGVAYQYTSHWQDAVLWRSIEIPNPPQRFYADPFVIRHDDKDIMFVEDYCYQKGRACISAIELQGKSHQLLGSVIEEPFHMSYPFLFKAEGALYMCPETYQTNEIRLYKCDEFPAKWSLHRVLMKDISAVDTNIVFHQGKWWMMTNVDKSGLREFGSELHLYSADTFDTDDWTPHPQNPVIFDSNYARNGGLIIGDDGQLYRVFQIQGFGVYGEAMGVAKVLRMDEGGYEETRLFDIPAHFFEKLKGTHTYSFDNGLLALDFVRLESTRS